MIMQSDSGQIVESLVPGTYLLSVSRMSGSGGYRLTTSFIQTANPFAPLARRRGHGDGGRGRFERRRHPDIVIGQSGRRHGERVHGHG